MARGTPNAKQAVFTSALYAKSLSEQASLGFAALYFRVAYPKYLRDFFLDDQ